LNLESNNHFLAKTLHGLEEVLAKELQALGAKDIRVLKRAVSFSGNKKLLYRANLELRTALRILVPFHSFRVRHESALYNRIKQIDWSQFMNPNDTLAIDGVTHSKYFNHSKYVALKTKDAIVDQFRDKFGKRPNVNTYNPTLRVNVHINEDQCTVSLDSSSESLHKRGYRREVLEAPINEVLAAGMIQLSGWKKDCNFIDAMCGSGTILFEAFLYARNIPPQYHREYFGFKMWKDFDEKLWEEVVKEAKERQCDFNYKILGFDKDFQAIRITERNMEQADLVGQFELKRKKFELLQPPSEKGILIMNPPYDERIQHKNINDLYEMIGERFKHAFPGYEAWIISSNMEALKHIGLRPSRRISLYNGALDCKFLKFELYAGSKKTKKNEKLV
jgi:23S rRNA (guanine2445-N2)-methyltransferase